MNSKKVFAKNAADYLEARILNLDTTNDYRESDIRINPKSSSLLNKLVVINLPPDKCVYQLDQFNEILSRFPLKCDRYRLKPYSEKDIHKEVNNKISPLILTKDLMTNPDMVDEVLSNTFLLGTDIEVENYITIIGVKLLMNEVTTT